MANLKVLQVSSSDTWGGAARAACRLHRALRNAAIASDMLVLDRRGQEPHVIQRGGRARALAAWTRARAGKMLLKLQKTPTNPVWHSLNAFPAGLAAWIDSRGYDVVNLHWLGSEMLSVEEIGRIRTPTCWTLHDMWPFCGAEHYDDLTHPGRYRSGYSRDNRPADYRGPDLDAWVWARKRKAWAGHSFHLVSPSRWLAECAAQSVLMRDATCSVIPNCVGEHVFKPLEPGHARRVLRLDPAKRYVLFGAMSSTSDARKGFSLLQRALQSLATVPGIAGTVELLVFGAAAPAAPPDLGLPVRYLGTFQDDADLAMLYNAADVFALPSMQDNLPNTLFEALACGTPGVAFAVGGIPDLLQHQVNGWLAQPFEVEDFAAGLRHWLDVARAPQRRALLPSAQFTDSSVVARYAEIYRSLR